MHFLHEIDDLSQKMLETPAKPGLQTQPASGKVHSDPNGPKIMWLFRLKGPFGGFRAWMAGKIIPAEIPIHIRRPAG